MSTPTDQIRLGGLRVLSNIGVPLAERNQPQPLELDVDVVLDTSAAGHSDDLVDSLDYGELTVGIAALFDDQRFALLERAAQAVADHVLTDPRVHEVIVEVRKLRPPVPVDLDTSSVRIHRTRSPI